MRDAARALDEDFDIEVHRNASSSHKVDAPSGTALDASCKAAAEGRGIDLDSRSVRSARWPDRRSSARSATSALPRMRGGSVVGEHSVILAGEGERIVVSHIAQDRSIFARGAVKAALWAQGPQARTCFSMTDVLGSFRILKTAGRNFERGTSSIWNAFSSLFATVKASGT